MSRLKRVTPDKYRSSPITDTEEDGRDLYNISNVPNLPDEDLLVTADGVGTGFLRDNNRNRSRQNTNPSDSSIRYINSNNQIVNAPKHTLNVIDFSTPSKEGTTDLLP
eukprot:UN11713